MENQILAKFLTLIDSDLSEFKSIGLTARYAVIDSYGNEELSGLADYFDLSVPELRTKLNQEANDLDKKDVEPTHKKSSHIPHIEEDEEKHKRHTKIHKFRKPTEHDKEKVKKRIKNPRPIEHKEKGHINHTDRKNPPPPPPNPPKLPPLTIDDVTIIATYKIKK